MVSALLPLIAASGNNNNDKSESFVSANININRSESKSNQVCWLAGGWYASKYCIQQTGYSCYEGAPATEMECCYQIGCTQYSTPDTDTDIDTGTDSSTGTGTVVDDGASNIDGASNGGGDISNGGEATSGESETSDNDTLTCTNQTTIPNHAPYLGSSLLYCNDVLCLATSRSASALALE